MSVHGADEAILGDLSRSRLQELGFDIAERAAGGLSQGAWFARRADGQPVVLKWSSDSTMAHRYATLLPGLKELRARGVPVPEYFDIIRLGTGTLSAQQFLPGRSEDNPASAAVHQMVRYIDAKLGIAGPPPTGDSLTWGEFVVRTLRIGQKGWAMHEPLQNGDPRAQELLRRAKATGIAADASWFRDDGLVHLDLHTDNVLIEAGSVSGIIDWEGACAGDSLYDLVQFAFDLEGHNQPIWDIVDGAGFERRVLRAYVALLGLKCTSWAILFRPDDVARQLERAERVFARYGV